MLLAMRADTQVKTIRFTRTCNHIDRKTILHPHCNTKLFVSHHPRTITPISVSAHLPHFHTKPSLVREKALTMPDKLLCSGVTTSLCRDRLHMLRQLDYPAVRRAISNCSAAERTGRYWHSLEIRAIFFGYVFIFFLRRENKKHSEGLRLCN